MMKVLLICTAIALALVAVSFVSCGASSPCQDIMYKICDCEHQANKDSAARDKCYTEVDKASFSAEEDSECSKYKDTCTCDTYKSAEADTKCPANFGGGGA